MVIVMSDINLFTDLFNDGLTTEQERVIDEILRELESGNVVGRRCRSYVSELEDDGVHPPLTMRLEQDEGEDVWCTTCHLRWLCKVRRKISNSSFLRRQKEFLKETWLFFLLVYGVVGTFVTLFMIYG